ncbi:MAG: AbrB/MazE/SpoVT family DNA-binding domain-containing protein [Spirochaetaceae bacterium]|nr:MAG: AbrB/MazE/SpoVT family DNA-binding domain-containing protein [Spirochaetaceae bacterium]
MRVTEKGQVTIPQAIRNSLGIKPGTEVEFILEGDSARLRRVSRPDVVAERRQRFAGSADAGLSTEDILRLTRR